LLQVTGLAKKLHESPRLRAKFEEIIFNDVKAGKLKTHKTALDRRVPTRWNSDYQCLQSYKLLRNQVERLESLEPELEIYRLTPRQRELIDALIPLLHVCGQFYYLEALI
jgi:hypothetical protein